MIKHIEPGLFLNTETGKLKYSSVCAACVNLHYKWRYPEEYATTIGCRGRFLDQALT
tara:strand:+ start:183 stop:353 length:171 start_codon:yes stop_codon:yes gene_type:complete